MKSNGWTDGTAALQLFAHLDGEALNVALLMPEEEWDKWEGLSQGLSDYYNSPGRLAVFRRQFESAIHRPAVYPATFATELGIIAVRGFGDMGKRARDSMIRDICIAAQRNWESQAILGNSDVSGRIHRSSGMDSRVPVTWLVLVRGVLRLNGKWGRGMVSWLPWKPYPHW